MLPPSGYSQRRCIAQVLVAKWKILSSKIKRLAPPANSIWIDYRVIFCGKADSSAISEDERRYTCELDDFLKITNLSNYNRVFPPDHKQVSPSYDLGGAFNKFFRGPEFKPTAFSYHDFQITCVLTF